MASLVSSGALATGLGPGALGTSVLMKYGPAPTRLIYWLLLGPLVLGAFAVLAMREPGARHQGRWRRCGRA